MKWNALKCFQCLREEINLSLQILDLYLYYQQYKKIKIKDMSISIQWTKCKLIHEHQSGFRKNHSCQTALVKPIDQWMSCIGKGDFVGTLFLDLRKAFDVVDHTILIEKLAAYKFSNSSLRWFKFYLNRRRQVVQNGKLMPAFFMDLY